MPRVSEMLPPSPTTPTTGMWEAMDGEMQEWLSGIAANVKILIGRMRSDDAYDELRSHQLDVEAEAALWTRLDSNERRVLKAVGATRKEMT